MEQPQIALKFLDEALPLIKKGGNTSHEAYALHRMGDAYRLIGQLDKALEYYQQALELRQTLDEKIQDANTRTWISQTEILRGNLLDALFQSDRALALVEQVRRQYTNPLLGASFNSSAHQYYAEHIALLFKLHAQQPTAGYDVQAFQTSERAQARALLESLSDLSANLRAELPAALTEREESLYKMVNRVISERDKVAR